MKKKVSSTRKFLNLATLTEHGIKGFNKQELIFYAVVPYNLSVLSEDNVEAKIFTFMNVLKSFSNVEIICLNSRENFKHNKVNIQKRIQEEPNPMIQTLLKMDLKQLDEIQLTTATARSFLICVRINENNANELQPYLNRIEKSLKVSGFSIKRLSKEELKTMFAVYYEQDVTTEKFEEFDGERWYLQ